MHSSTNSNNTGMGLSFIVERPFCFLPLQTTPCGGDIPSVPAGEMRHFFPIYTSPR